MSGLSLFCVDKWKEAPKYPDSTSDLPIYLALTFANNMTPFWKTPAGTRVPYWGVHSVAGLVVTPSKLLLERIQKLEPAPKPSVPPVVACALSSRYGHVNWATKLPLSFFPEGFLKELILHLVWQKIEIVD